MKNGTYVFVTHDIKSLFFDRAFLWLPLVVLVIVESNAFLSHANVYQLAFKKELELSFADLSFLIYQGAPIYVPDPNNPFSIPGFWMSHNLYIAFLMCWYPVIPYLSLQTNVLLACKNRKIWWQKKYITCIFVVLCSYFIEYAVAFFATITYKTPFAFSPDLLSGSFNVFVDPNHQNFWWLYVLIFPILVSLAITSMQIALSIKFGLSVSCFLTAIYIALAAYSSNPVFIGNFSMPLRSLLVGVQNGCFNLGIPIIFVMIVTSYLLGQKWFQKADILQNRGGFVS